MVHWAIDRLIRPCAPQHLPDPPSEWLGIRRLFRNIQELRQNARPSPTVRAHVLAFWGLDYHIIPAVDMEHVSTDQPIDSISMSKFLAAYAARSLVAFIHDFRLHRLLPRPLALRPRPVSLTLHVDKEVIVHGRQIICL